MRSYRPSLKISVEPLEATSSLLPSKTVRADESGVPRFQSFTIREYPDVVSDPGPSCVPTKRVSPSRQATLDFASGREKPPDTNCLLSLSNSRSTESSEPPGER